jgi:ribosomal protein L37E
MDQSILVGVVVGLLVPVLLLAAFQLFSERRPGADRPAEGREGLTTRVRAAAGRLIPFVAARPRERSGSGAGRERSSAHARPQDVDLPPDWDDEEDLFVPLGRPRLVAVGPGRPDADDDWEAAPAGEDDKRVSAVGIEHEEAPFLGVRPGAGDGALRVRITTTGVDGRTTVLDDNAPTVSCPRCGYRHSAAASYCRRCGYSQSNRPVTRLGGATADQDALARRGRR